MSSIQFYFGFWELSRLVQMFLKGQIFFDECRHGDNYSHYNKLDRFLRSGQISQDKSDWGIKEIMT